MNVKIKTTIEQLKTIVRRLGQLAEPKKVPLAIGALLITAATIGAVAIMQDQEPAATTSQVPTTNQTSEATDNTKPIANPEPKTVVADYTLTPYRGSIYGIKKPADWKVVDNLSAIETSDPADPLTGVSGSIVLGAFGAQTPAGHLQYVLDSIGATNVAYLQRSQEERVQERFTGLTWVIKTQVFTFTDVNGNQVKAKASAGVLQGTDQYVAMITAFQTTPAKWDKWAPALERIMQTIQIIDGSRVGGIDKVRLPTAADVKSDSSPLMDSWKYRNASGDRNSQGYSDATLGQESGLTSPSTSTEYTLPLSSYDPTIAGYRNPDNTSEILQDTF